MRRVFREYLLLNKGTALAFFERDMVWISKAFRLLDLNEVIMTDIDDNESDSCAMLNEFETETKLMIIIITI